MGLMIELIWGIWMTLSSLISWFVTSIILAPLAFTSSKLLSVFSEVIGSVTIPTTKVPFSINAIFNSGYKCNCVYIWAYQCVIYGKR